MLIDDLTEQESAALVAAPEARAHKRARPIVTDTDLYGGDPRPGVEARRDRRADPSSGGTAFISFQVAELRYGALRRR
jgi:hypothetical protein